MITFVIGGSGSGKSEYAEGLVVNTPYSKRYYVATMYPFDEECKNKIRRHQKMREDKGFETRECFTSIPHLEVEHHSVVLLECLSNLVANEMFQPEGYHKDVAKQIIEDLNWLETQVEELIIVSNDIFHDGVRYDGEMEEYVSNLANIHTWIATAATKVIEVVYTIPIYHKGEESNG